MTIWLRRSIVAVLALVSTGCFVQDLVLRRVADAAAGEAAVLASESDVALAGAAIPAALEAHEALRRAPATALAEMGPADADLLYWTAAAWAAAVSIAKGDPPWLAALPIVVLVPLVAPLGVALGVHPPHLGIIFLANLEIGYLTPPVGMNLFFSSCRFGQPIGTVFAAILPVLGWLIAALLLITYVPWLSTALLHTSSAP